MIQRFVLILVITFQTLHVDAQKFAELGKIVDSIKKNALGEISTKCFDLDNDGDNDYMCSFTRLFQKSFISYRQ